MALPTGATIGRARVRAVGGPVPDRAAIARRCAPLHDLAEALPPSGVLVVRCLVDRLPVGPAARGSAGAAALAWAGQLDGQLRHLAAGAARPSVGAAPADAEAVWFDDEALTRACYCTDLVRGAAPWWWARLGEPLGTDVEGALGGEPALTAAVVEVLALAGALDEVLRALPAAAAERLAGDVARAAGAGELAVALAMAGGPARRWRADEPVWQVRQTAAGSGGPQGGGVPPWPLPVAFEAVVPAALPLSAHLLAGVAATARAGARHLRTGATAVSGWAAEAAATSARSSQRAGVGGAPCTEAVGASTRGRRGGHALDTWASARTGAPSGHGAGDAGRTGTVGSMGEHHQSAAAEPARDGGALGAVVAGSRAGLATGMAATHGRRAGSDPGVGSGGGARTDAAPTGRRASTSTGGGRGAVGGSSPGDAVSRGDATERALSAGGVHVGEVGVVATSIAGAFCAIEVARRLDVLERDDAGGWAVVEALSRVVLDDGGDGHDDDPLWALLAALDGRDPRTPLDAPALQDWAGVAGADVRAWLREVLGADPRRLVARPGVVHVSTAHVDVILAVEDAWLPARRAGLDRDPGWVPALGRVVAHHHR